MSAHVDHEASLRAALHRAAESLEPRADGLERIRARLRQPRPAYVAWAQAASAEIVFRTPALLQEAAYRAADWLRLAYERFTPAQAPGRHRSRTQGLLRPLAAMAVVMFIVAAGTYVAISASTAIFPSSSSSQPGGGAAGGHSRGAGPGPSHTSSQGPAGTGSQPAAPPSCKPTSLKPGTTSAAPPPAQSANPSPTPADTSTSPDPSASPTDTSTTSTASVAPSAQPSANAPVTQTTTPPVPPRPTPSC